MDWKQYRKLYNIMCMFPCINNVLKVDKITNGNVMAGYVKPLHAVLFRW